MLQPKKMIDQITSWTFSGLDPSEARRLDLSPGFLGSEFGTTTENRVSSSDMSISGALTKIV